MPVVTRAFTQGDGVSIWTLLNEIRGWIDALSSQGVSARYWTGYPTAKSLASGSNVSVKPSNTVDDVGSVTPTWDGDVFSLPAGKYRIDAQLSFDANSTGYRVLSLLKNPGVTAYNSSSTPPGTFLRAVQTAASTNNTSVQLTKIVTVTATDKLMLVGRQNSGGGLNILGTQQDSELMIVRVGD